VFKEQDIDTIYIDEFDNEIQYENNDSLSDDAGEKDNISIR
jgi:hypothetical protein